MNQDEFRKNFNRLLAEERKEPMRWWYLSYASAEDFLGGVYIQAHGPAEAAYLSNRRGHSPGGEVYIVGPVPEEYIPEPHFCNRLLSKTEVQEANPDCECKTLADFEAEAEKESE